MARMRGRRPGSTQAVRAVERLRTKQAGHFRPNPQGRRGLWASYVVAPPQRLDKAESLRRRASSESQIPGVAGPKGFFRGSCPSARGPHLTTSRWAWMTGSRVSQMRRSFWSLCPEPLSEPIGPALGRKWPGCEAERRGDSSLIESLRSDNEAGGPLPAQPGGTPGLGASSFVAPPQRLGTA